MKRCPQCSRTYTDETLNFCLDDGEWLLADDEPATAIQSLKPGAASGVLSEQEAIPTASNSAEPATRVFSNTTDQTAILPSVSLPGGNSHPTSSAEYIVRGMRNNKRSVLAAFAILVLAAGGFSYWYFKLRGASSSETASINSIAVLPFQNKSDDADTDYLSDGLTESLIFRLTQLPGLKVSPTSSVVRYKDKETDLAKIANELGVDSIMTGRLVKRGANLDITVELVDARNNKSLWGEQYQRKMSDLLATQRDIAASIVQKLQLKLDGDEKGIAKNYTDSNEAYQLYLKGRFHFAKRTKQDILQSINLFQQAIKLDPNFALAYAGIAESYSVMPSYPYMSPNEATPLAKAAVAKALEIDPDLPEAHTIAGMIAATYDWDWAKADSEFKRALELDPNLALTHFRYAWVYLSPIGRHDEAIAEMKRAMELEPLSLVQGANFAAVYVYARQYDNALDMAKKTYELDPSLVTGQVWLCHAYDMEGRYNDSLAISAKAPTESNSLQLSTSGYAYAKSGHRQEAEAIVNQYREIEKTRYISNYWLAINLVALGEKEAAFIELEKAYQAHDWFLQRLKVDPYMDPLRDDPRFNEMVKRLNLPQ